MSTIVYTVIIYRQNLALFYFSETVKKLRCRLATQLLILS